MKLKTNTHAGGTFFNHNQTLVRERGLGVRTGVRAGGLPYNHNQTQVLDQVRGDEKSEERA